MVANFELTDEVKERAVLNIYLTIFLSFLFALGSFVFNNDAHELMHRPIARLTSVTSAMSSQLFSIDAGSIHGNESAYIESVLTKVARFFETEMHKVTTLYTPNNEVWTIDVKKEKEEVARVVGSTHRITSGDLHNMCKGAKKSMVRKFLFMDFLSDPLAVRYFHTFLAAQEVQAASEKSASTRFLKRMETAVSMRKIGDAQNTSSTSEGAASIWGEPVEQDPPVDYNENVLLFWEDIRRYKKAMSSATFHARRMFKTYVHPEGECALDLTNAIVQHLYDEAILGFPNPATFDAAEKDVLSSMRKNYFGDFLASDTCTALILAKKGLPKAIMVENEYGQEELEDLKQMSGSGSAASMPPLALNLPA